MTDRVREACEACFESHKGDCSGFARAVAAELGVTLAGMANDIVATLRSGPAWTALPDGVAARDSARAGKLVVAGLEGSKQTQPDIHGHVVVVVDGELARGLYPTAYWGSLGGAPGQNQTLNFAWVAGDRDRVVYAAHDLGAAG